MAELLKNLYNKDFFSYLCADTQKIIPLFDEELFTRQVFTCEWGNLELKQRMSHVASVFRNFLHPEYPAAVQQLILLTKCLKSSGHKNILPLIFIPDILEKYGTEHFDISVPAMEKITSLISCEFAVRPYLIKYPEKMMVQMLKWSLSKDEHVRRFASEGVRPMLPWAMAVPFLKKNPSPILPVLENLKNDPSEYVRRSVANNLNDISKDHPDIVLAIARQWSGKSLETDKILKHACRSLIKKGNDAALEIFGFENKDCIGNSSLKLNRKNFKLGDELNFSFSGIAENTTDLRLQFIVDFVKSTGRTGEKVFFLGERSVKKGETISFSKKISLTNYTTRKLYSGRHTLRIMVNGVTVAAEEFQLTV